MSNTTSSGDELPERMAPSLGGSARSRKSKFVRKERRRLRVSKGPTIKTSTKDNDESITQSPTTSTTRSSSDEADHSLSPPLGSTRESLDGPSGDQQQRALGNGYQTSQLSERSESQNPRSELQLVGKLNLLVPKSSTTQIYDSNAREAIHELLPSDQSRQSTVSSVQNLQLPVLTESRPKRPQKSQVSLASHDTNVDKGLNDKSTNVASCRPLLEPREVKTENPEGSPVREHSVALKPQTASRDFEDQPIALASAQANSDAMSTVTPINIRLNKHGKELSSPSDHTVSTSASDSSSSDTPMKCLPSRTPNLFDGNLYRDRSQALAVLSVAESKRQCWMQNEIQAGEREWDYYLSRLDKATQETQQIETFLANSNVALVQYSQAIDTMCSGSFSVPSKTKVEDFIDKESNNPMFKTLSSCYSALKESLESQLPEMTSSLRQATLLRAEVGTKAAALEKRGSEIGWYDTKRVEETIKDSFEALLKILMQQADPSAVEPHDRWLAEARYRNSARLGLDTWKATRNAYQTVYLEFWKLEDSRKLKQRKILTEFLPLRRSLMQTTNFAFDAGADVVGGESKPLDLAKTFDLSENQVANRSIWSSSYVEDCRVVKLKVGRDWRTSLATKCLDRQLHLYVSDETEWLSVDDLMEKLQTEEVYVSAELANYSIENRDGNSAIELERTNRSKIFRKRQDLITIQLKDPEEAARWCKQLLETSSEQHFHC